MSAITGIEYVKRTFNPWSGCSHVGPGCDHCYAERIGRRFKKMKWGAGEPRIMASERTWAEPHAWNRLAGKKGIRERVLCASMSDVFDREAPEGARERLWETIKATPNLDWLIPTKRIGNAPEMLPADWGAGYPNVMGMPTICNQMEADRDLPKFLSQPWAAYGVSHEPALGGVDFNGFLKCDAYCLNGTDDGRWHCTMCGKNLDEENRHNHRALDQIVMGGESGPGARPMHPDWPRSVRDQCLKAGVPFFFKQWGAWLHESQDYQRGAIISQAHYGAGNRNKIHHWPDSTISVPCGKKKAGRLLYGQTHDEFPEVG